MCCIPFYLFIFIIMWYVFHVDLNLVFSTTSEFLFLGHCYDLSVFYAVRSSYLGNLSLKIKLDKLLLISFLGTSSTLM